MATERDYILGTHQAELERLGLQHRIWRSNALQAWRSAGFSSGQTILDIGSGPGYASLDLAGIVGSAGRVLAVDRSRLFLDALNEQNARLGVANIETLELDLDEEPLPAVQADGAWSRWVFCFVREPRLLLEKVRDALRPGGTFVSYEYFDYSTWRLSPRSAPFEEFVATVMKSWRANGGEPDIGLDLPIWLPQSGFKIQSVRPIVEVVGPSDFFWQWPKAFVEIGTERLEGVGYMTGDQAAKVRESFSEAELNPHALVITPAVLEIIAVRQ